MPTVEDSANGLEQWISEIKEVRLKPLEPTEPLKEERGTDSKKDVRQQELAQLNDNIRSIQEILDQYRDKA